MAGAARPARVLQRAGIPFIVVELNHAVFSGLAEDPLSGIWGDITGEQILKAAQIENARILLLTVPDRSTIRLAVEHARYLNPQVVIIARATQTAHLGELRDLGVNSVIQSEFECGVEMVRQALIQCETSEPQTARLVAEVRDEYYSGAI
jgi:CPA2 family monovalent cation:H+ antiporter-2